MRTKNERLEYCRDWNKWLDDQYATLKSKRTEAMKYLNADPNIVAVLENRSKITTTDMQDAIDMAKPDILETIAGIDEPLILEPGNASFVEKVKKLQVLGNIMIKRKNKWYRICSDFLDDSMALQFGCIKYRWVSENKVTSKTLKNLDDTELQTLLQQEGASLAKDTPTKNDEPRKTKINYTAIDEYVRFDVVPSERIKFPLDTQDFAETPMVIEEVRLYEHEFVKYYGQKALNEVKKIIESLDVDRPDAAFSERFRHVGGLDGIYDKKSGKYKAYECYFWEGDIPWVTTYVADQVVLDEENEYGKPPYRGGSPFLIAHSLIGKGYYDCIKSIQEQNTFLTRQISDIITQNNYRRMFIDINRTGMNIDDYENNSAMNALVRCDGSVGDDAVRPEPKVSLGGDVLQYYELLQVKKDGHIPTPRTYGGLESSSDDKTYRGQRLKVNQASKKLLMMMRGYMEEVFAPLFQDMLDCLAKFMSKKTTVRYLNEDYDIAPDDVICEFSQVVNIGLGAHDKQDLIVKLQQLIGLGMQQLQFGVITPQNLFYMNQELVKAMGFLNTTDFVTDPKLKETILQFIHMAMVMMQHMGDMHQVPEMSQAISEMMQMAQQVTAALGIKQQPSKGGTNPQGTQPGEQPAAIPNQAMEPLNPSTQIDGNGFFA